MNIGSLNHFFHKAGVKPNPEKLKKLQTQLANNVGEKSSKISSKNLSTVDTFNPRV